MQWNPVVIQTLYLIAAQSAQMRHHFVDAFHFHMLQRHPSRHDHTDIAGAQNNRFLSRFKSLYIDILLHRSGCQHACRAGAQDSHLRSRPLPTAHGQDNGLCLPAEHTVFLADRVNLFFRRDLRFLYHVDIALRIFAAGKLPAEPDQAKPVMDALIQYAAQLPVSLYENDLIKSFLLCL